MSKLFTWGFTILPVFQLSFYYWLPGSGMCSPWECRIGIVFHSLSGPECINEKAVILFLYVCSSFQCIWNNQGNTNSSKYVFCLFHICFYLYQLGKKIIGQLLLFFIIILLTSLDVFLYSFEPILIFLKHISLQLTLVKRQKGNRGK